jgi:hypothetical protein
MFEAALKEFSIKISELEILLESPSSETVPVAAESGDCATAFAHLVMAQSRMRRRERCWPLFACSAIARASLPPRKP